MYHLSIVSCKVCIDSNDYITQSPVCQGLRANLQTPMRD